ncbi:ArnT family glycosyltransferase [Chromobacterium haemolyticum]|uniref:ArnT family glycosyltransferase n=1 Tax=Chromobacterium haemolyticum TaxID=394935 RepID=UPI0015E76981|nr:UDP phosphate-alpha-4-amino-4-deoxy-L- arabinose arabinosyl transferase [Chromobacterium haemolyticum]
MRFSTPPAEQPADSGLPPVPAWLFLLIAVAWLLPGLIGHEPWKPDEAYTFGLVRHIAETGDWIVPTLAGEPFMEKPPLFFISAAFTMQLFGGWLSAPDAARLAAGGWMALALAGTAVSAGALYGRRAAAWGALLLLGCLGLPMRAHQMITDTALLAGVAWGLAGLVLLRRRAWLGGALLGLGGGAAFLSKGLLGPGCLGLTALLLPLHPDYRNRRYAGGLLLAALIGLPLAALWGLSLYLRDPALFQLWFKVNNFGRFDGSAHLGPKAPRLFYGRTLPWYGIPVLPLALWGLWRGRRQWTRAWPAAPALLWLVTLTVLSLAGDARELYAMPLLLPLALLAITGLRAGEAHRGWRALSGFSLLLCLTLGAVVLVVAWVLSTGEPAQWASHLLHRKFTDWHPQWHPWTWLAFGLIAGGVIRLWRRFPADTAPGFAWRWSLTIVLLWGGLATLWLPALDHGMRYRETFAPLRPVLADISRQGECVASVGLGEPQRALLDYYADYRTLRLESAPQAKNCRWLLVQSLHDQLPPYLASLKPAESFQRPGDPKERFRLYRLEQPLGQLLKAKK